MLSAAAQILAFVLALLGTLGATVATLLPNWQVSIRVWSSMVAPMWHTRGLWMDCVWYGVGVFSCTTNKSPPLALPPYLQTTRAAMVLSCVLAAFGLCLASLGLRCTRWGGGQRAKGRTAVTAGGCFVLAAALCLGPASWFTSEVVAAFMSAQQSDGSKYQPGGALCVTFVSAGFLLAAGVIFCLSCPGSASQDYPTPTDIAPTRAERWRPQRVGREKSPVGVGASERDVKDSYSRQEYV
ncbi:claudin-20-like [Syngnathus acus]|uniref:claudin-20-like n=1 Tax=Syngnathus acus TaxID=161584 RepID=UPI00188628A7|nr:claudin-20-like [Syngnathus acus]XP_037100503.1 claudin-20-like [Syngnathus acus]